MRAAPGTQAPKHRGEARAGRAGRGPWPPGPSTLPWTPRASSRGWAEAFPKPQSPLWTTVRAHSCSDGMQDPLSTSTSLQVVGRHRTSKAARFPGHRPPREPQAAFSHLLTPPHLPPKRRLSWPLSAAGSALRAGVHPGGSHRPTADRAFQPPPSRVPNATTDPATATAPPRSLSPLGAPHRRPQAPPPFRPPASITEPALPPRLRHWRGPETQGCRLRHPGARWEGSGPPAGPGPRRPGAAARAAGQRPGARASAAAGQGQRAARAEPQPCGLERRPHSWRSEEGAVGAAAPRGGGRGRCDWRGRGLPQWARRAWLGAAGGARTGAAASEGEGNGLDGEEGGLAAGGGCGRRGRGGEEAAEGGVGTGRRWGTDGAHTETARGLRWGRRGGRPD